MYADARIRSAFAGMIEAIPAPPVPIADILAKSALPAPAVRRTPRWRAAAIAAAAALVFAVALPAVAPGLVQTVEARLAAILGWTPPPMGPPKWLTSQLRGTNVTFAQAQSQVPFALVAPQGLPHDAVPADILATRTGLYERATRVWSIGTNAVFFEYRRANGRTFSLLADRYDPRTGPPGKFMFEDTGKMRDGLPVLIKHRHFEWRNGDQVMSATDGPEISAAEIRAIAAAMHGSLVTPASGRREMDSDSIVRFYPYP